jgi:tetratricopeptide (TPR) repeat protein
VKLPLFFPPSILWALVFCLPVAFGQVAPPKSLAQKHAEKGYLLAQSGDLKQAEAELQRALVLSPNDPSYLATLGGILGTQERLEEACVYFEKAVKIDPRNVVTRRNLAVNQWLLGRLEQAQANLQRILKVTPDDKLTTLLLGMVARDLKDYGRAASLLASVPALLRQHPEAVAALANSYYRTGRKEQARQTLRLLEGRPGDSQGVIAGARVAAEAEDSETAERMYLSIRATHPDTTTLDYNLALICYRAGRYEEGQKLLLDLVSASHANTNIWNLLGWCYQRQNKTQEAVRALEKAIRADPSKESNYLDLSLILSAGEHLGAAREVSEKTVEVFPDSALAHRLKGTVETKQGKFLNAARTYARAVELNPASPDAYLGLIVAQWKAGMTAEATATFEKAVQKFPRDPVFYETYGAALLTSAPDQATEARAIRLLEKAIALDSSRAEAQYQLGNLVLRKDQAEVSTQDLLGALEHLEVALRLRPKESKTHYALARVYARLGRREESNREFAILRKLKAEEDVSAPRYFPSARNN